jgi:hydroxyacylglutathione hydrolase
MQNLTPTTHLIPEQHGQYFPDCNVYVLGTKEDFILVDTGNGSHTSEKIESLKKGGFDMKNCQYVVGTHFHYDHINGCSEIGKPCKMHEHDANEVNKKNGEAIFGSRTFEQAASVGLKFHEFQVVDKLVGGEKLRVGGQSYEVLHTPGHTKGSLCLWNDQEKSLFSGDTLFADSIGRTDLFSANDSEMKETLRRLKTLGIGKLMPGHGTPLNNGAARVKQVVEYFLERL